MSIEAREPPSQFVFRLRRALGGRAGWNGFVFQLLFVAALIWLGYEIIANAKANLAAQRITSGFGFLQNNAGFDVNQTLIPFSGSDSYIRVFFVGLLNTLVVAVVGIFFATILGFAVALGRLSPNWLLSRIAGGYVELIRNLPPLFQILFWYKAVLSALPNPRQSYSVFGFLFPCEWGVDWVTRLLGSYCTAAPDSSPSWLHGFFLSNRGLVVPKPIATAGLEPFLIAAVVGIVAAFVLRRYARKELFDKGRKIMIWPYVLGLIIGLPGLAILIFGIPFTLEIPALRGFNFSGGSRIIPEFVALTLALSTYTAAFIAEIVRAGIMSVHKGQMEAGASLGLSRGQTLRMIVVPQAMRVILPPLTNQYLNLTKNSSLAVAIGYPDLVSVFAGTTLSQTGQAIEIISITMGVYLLISLVTSAIMSFYGWRLDRSMQR
jgi:general L-amino acid transport system permease protein